MNSIIEDLECIIPEGYSIKLNYVDETEEGVSIIEDSISCNDNLLNNKSGIMQSEVQFYLQSKRGNTYNKSISSMLDIKEGVCGLLYKEVGNKYILDVKCGQILNLGAVGDLDAVSLNVIITYKIIK